MKQAEAFAGVFRGFSLVIARGVLRSEIDSVDLQDWYGLRRRFRIVRLPFSWRVKAPYFSNHRLPAFDTVASCYARLVSADIVYTRSPGAARRCIRLRLPTIFETHAPGMYDIEHVLPLVEHPSFLGIVTVTDALKENYIQMGIPGRKILVEPDAIDIERFQPIVGKHAARARLGLSGHRPVAMYCGHLYPEKGVNTAIEAARLCPEIDFYFVGGWPEDIEKMKLIASGLNNVHFAGFVTNESVPTWLAAADILLMPNSGKTEHAKFTSPLKWFEYMAAERPIVASDIPALKGHAIHGENAYLFQPDSVRQLAEAVTRLSADEAMAARLGTRARKEVEQHTWVRRARRIARSFHLQCD